MSVGFGDVLQFILGGVTAPAIQGNPLLRTSAPRHDFEIRLFIGPKHGMVTMDNIAAGMGFYAEVSTTLTSDVDPGDTVLNVASTEAFTTGALMVLTGGDYRPEFMTYGATSPTQFQQLSRQIVADDGVSGWHFSGDIVTEFVEISHIVTNLSLNFSDRGHVASWAVTLRGFRYDSMWLNEDNAVLCMIRQTPAYDIFGLWTDWRVWWHGYIHRSEGYDSGKQDKAWTVEVQPLSQYLAVHEILPRTYGRIDLAESATVTVSSWLEDPLSQADGGEFLGLPNLDGDNVNDGDLGTLWISEGEPQLTPNSFLESYFSINEVLLRPARGDPENLQWFEVAYKAPDKNRPFRGYVFCAKCTTWEWEEWDHYKWDNDAGEYVYVGPGAAGMRPANNYIHFDWGHEKSMSDDGSFTIVCRDKAQFLEKYPNHGASYVFDWRHYEEGNFELDVTGDFLYMCHYGASPEDVVWWSDGNSTWEAQAPYNFLEPDDPLAGPDDSGWTGDMISSHTDDLPLGHSFRRDPEGNKPNILNTPNSKAYFELDEQYPTPGSYITGLPEWVMFDLQALGLQLDGPLYDTDTYIQLNKEPIGLASPSWESHAIDGYCFVHINTEIIGYTGIDWNNHRLTGLARGQFGTSIATEHPDESTVKQYEESDDPEEGMVDYDCHLIQQVVWRRREVYDSNDTLIIPRVFDLYISTSISPNDPGQPVDEESWEDWNLSEELGGWESHWRLVQHVELSPDNYETYWTSEPLGAPRRARFVLLIIREMTDNGPAKLNELHVYAPHMRLNNGNGEDEMVEGITTGAIIRDLLSVYGLPDSLIQLICQGGSSDDLKTTKTNVLSLMQSLCKRSGCMIRFEFDQGVTHEYHASFPLGGLSDVHVTWDRTNAREARWSVPFRHGVSQVRLTLQNQTTEDRFVVVYPGTPLTLGSTVEREDVLLGGPSQAELFAEYLFKQELGVTELTLIPVGPAEWIKPGMRCILNWTLDEEGERFQGRNFVVSSIVHNLNFGNGQPGSKSWRTTIKLMEIAL